MPDADERLQLDDVVAADAAFFGSGRQHNLQADRGEDAMIGEAIGRQLEGKRGVGDAGCTGRFAACW